MRRLVLVGIGCGTMVVMALVILAVTLIVSGYLTGGLGG